MTEYRSLNRNIGIQRNEIGLGRAKPQRSSFPLTKQSPRQGQQIIIIIHQHGQRRGLRHHVRLRALLLRRLRYPRGRPQGATASATSQGEGYNGAQVVTNQWVQRIIKDRAYEDRSITFRTGRYCQRHIKSITTWAPLSPKGKGKGKKGAKAAAAKNAAKPKAPKVAMGKQPPPKAAVGKQPPVPKAKAKAAKGNRMNVSSSD